MCQKVHLGIVKAEKIIWSIIHEDFQRKWSQKKASMMDLHNRLNIPFLVYSSVTLQIAQFCLW